MQEPPDICRELLSLRSGQQHAEIQGVQKSLFADPASLLDELRVHNGYLTGRPSETDEPQLQPEAQRFLA